MVDILFFGHGAECWSLLTENLIYSSGTEKISKQTENRYKEKQDRAAVALI